MKWCEKIHSVVTPSEISGEIGDRHHFNHANSNPGQFLKLFGPGLPRSFFGKGANVDFVNDVAFHVHAAPFCIGPFKLRWIDNTRRTVRTVRLKSRCRIGMKMFGPVHAETVERASADFCTTGEVTALFAFQRMKRAPGIFFRALFQHKIDILRLWRPDTEMSFVRIDYLGADRIAASSLSLHG